MYPLPEPIMPLPLPKLGALRALLAPLGREVTVSKRGEYLTVSSQDQDGGAIEAALAPFGFEADGRRYKGNSKWTGQPIGEVCGSRWDFCHRYTFSPRED